MPVPQRAHAGDAVAPQPGPEGSKVLLPTLWPITFAPCGTEEQQEVRGLRQAGRKESLGDLAQHSAASAGGPSQRARAPLFRQCDLRLVWVFPALGRGFPIRE